MLTPRTLIAGLALIGIVAVGAGALVPAQAPKQIRTTDQATPAAFSEVRRRDLTPRPAHDVSYKAPEDIGVRHRLFFSGKLRSYDALATGGNGGAAIVLLHGAGRDGRAMLDMWKATAQSHGVTLIAPNGMRGDWVPEDAAYLNAAVADAQKRYAFDPSRVFLFGHSAGAMAAQLYANWYEGPWQAVATHGGYIGAGNLQPVVEGVPMRIYLGSSDALFNPADGRSTAQRLAENGHPTEYHIIPEHGHWYYDIGPALASEVADWFLQSDGL